MKKVLIVLALVSSFSALAETKCSTILGNRVCGEVTRSGENFVISNLNPSVQVKLGMAKDLCNEMGDIVAEYKTKVSTTKACEYLSTRGFFRGGEVSSCLDFGGISAGRVYQKIKCIKKSSF